ncbi:unnamed protein product [Auanema sp. JU1783]|nr:unnamed protein product [Auanema sp. JU1783]
MSIQWGAQYPKLKTNLRLAVNRLKMMGKKKTEMAMKARTEIADFISIHKEDRARIRVEHIIREDFLVEAYEILEMFCDLLLGRFGLIEQMKVLDDGIAEAVISILWAAPRVACDIPEFKIISDQLTTKYGKPFAEAARGNQLDYPAKVNPKLIQKLSVSAPPKLLVERYLILISDAAGIPFTPDPDVMREDEIAQAEKLLIDFKNAGELTNPTPNPPYGWSNVMQPGPPPNVGLPMPPNSNDFFGQDPNDKKGGNNGGSGNGGGNIYEVPRDRSNRNHEYAEPPGEYPTQPQTFNDIPPVGQFQLPKIGPNGVPVYPNDASYPPLSQRNSVVMPHDKSGGASAPQPSSKNSLESEFTLPDPPTDFNHTNNGGGNGGIGGSLNLDFDELAKRFDQLKGKP